MAPVQPNPERIRGFADAAAWAEWLSQHHDSEPELWLRIFKKGSAVPTVTYAEALDVALCWGWIDGLKKSYDADSFLQRFTPRKAKSIWSQVNREHVARLIAQGRMTEHGMRHVDAAKADGRWDAAYASQRQMDIPADLLAAIEDDPKALETFQSLNKVNLYALAFRLGNIRTPAGRERKIKAFVTMLARGETIYPQSKGQPQ